MPSQSGMDIRRSATEPGVDMSWMVIKIFITVSKEPTMNKMVETATVVYHIEWDRATFLLAARVPTAAR